MNYLTYHPEEPSAQTKQIEKATDPLPLDNVLDSTSEATNANTTPKASLGIFPLPIPPSTTNQSKLLGSVLGENSSWEATISNQEEVKEHDEAWKPYSPDQIYNHHNSTLDEDADYSATLSSDISQADRMQLFSSSRREETIIRPLVRDQPNLNRIPRIIPQNSFRRVYNHAIAALADVPLIWEDDREQIKKQMRVPEDKNFNTLVFVQYFLQEKAGSGLFRRLTEQGDFEQLKKLRKENRKYNYFGRSCLGHIPQNRAQAQVQRNDSLVFDRLDALLKGKEDRESLMNEL